MTTASQSLVARVFYLIRSRDIELAEDYYRRCNPEVNSIREINAFFHQILAQYDSDTFNIRMQLLDTEDFNVWAESFVTHVLPFLVAHRFPSNTSRRIVPYYNDQHAPTISAFATI